VGLALVERAAQADVAVREREHRLALRQQLQIELGLVDLPRVQLVGRARGVH
jgi:hypothetical protein